MRFLLVTFEAGGNIPFEMSLAQTLVSNGHEVTVLGNTTLDARAKAAGTTLVPYSELADYDISVPRDVAELAETLVNRFMFGEFVASDVVALCERLDVSAVLVDSLLYAALAGAEKSGRPTASLWHTVMSDERRPYHNEGTLGRLNRVRSSLGLGIATSFRQQLDTAMVNLALTMEHFDAAAVSPPRNLAYAGPLVEWGPPDPVWRDDTMPLVVVSFSTMHLSHQAAVVQRVLHALAALDVRVLLTLGAGLRAEDLAIPSGIVSRRFVPHSDVLPYAALLITHGGYGSVVAGTLSGTPMLCLPLTEEEGAVAKRVEANGFGMRLSADETTVADIRSVVRQVLDDRALAERVSCFAKTLSPQHAKNRALELLQALAEA